MFVYYEEGIARCSLEKAYMNGETQWRKPLSCHLFPIRVAKNTATLLRYEKISECAGAKIKGRREDIPMYEFLKDPLVRKYGEEWYEKFRSECERRDNNIHG